MLLLLVVEAFTATKVVARRRLWPAKIVLLDAIDRVVCFVSDLLAIHFNHLAWKASHSLDVSCGSVHVERRLLVFL